MSCAKDMLAVEIAGIKMKTPVMTASGTFGFGLEFIDFIDLKQVGAIVVKGTTLVPRAGNSGRRIAETPAGMLNSIGLENPGVEEFVNQILPQLAQSQVPVIVNIAGNTVEEYGELAARLNLPDVAGLEINISCPNVKQGGIAFGTCPDSAAQVVGAVRVKTNKPVIAKLSPNVTDIVVMAKAVEAAGADAISLINTLLGMAIDIHSWQPVLGNTVGGLSGPAVKPVAVRMVWQVAQAVHVPVIGMGGIMTAADAIEFLLAGASAVSVGTANFINPYAAVNVAEGIRDYLMERGLTHVGEIVGKVGNCL
ncbi:dihydroorotate dehydrogenase B (NAD(+)), catalytic subunit [Methylomusa anaerophila]|uniref:Dihydroorotate dehydrogenase n=2 Tax=Methylomusa anaerophila TaxID=1930071 RepID=A0A348AQN3_9FIRM|nr:dihydroorotate dehydrogenase B (NAD(+)), catalytic subunit [Methylomusa anaerophila]